MEHLVQLWSRPLLALALTGLASNCARPHSRIDAEPRGADCFSVVYSPDSMGSGFPETIALGRGTDNGPAYWIPGKHDKMGVWRMFQAGATWHRTQGDSILVSYSNGFSGVTLELVPQEGGLLGRATWQSDVIDTLPPTPTEARATHVSCEKLLSN
jgi:hypothetical protein